VRQVLQQPQQRPPKNLGGRGNVGQHREDLFRRFLEILSVHVRVLLCFSLRTAGTGIGIVVQPGDNQLILSSVFLFFCSSVLVADSFLFEIP
jgi:hypothetical protein